MGKGKAFHAKEALRRTRWRIAMEEKYGGPDGLKEHFRELKRRSMQHPNNQSGRHTGGFSDPEIASMAGSRSKRGKAKPKKPKNKQTSETD